MQHEPTASDDAYEIPSEELCQLVWGKCTCLDDYKKRKLTDPQCIRCNWEDKALLRRIYETGSESARTIPRAQAEGMKSAEEWVPELSNYEGNSIGAKIAHRLKIVRAIQQDALASRQHSAPGWQPIETAPKDGSHFLIVLENSLHERHCREGWWGDDGWHSPHEDWCWTQQNFDEGEVLWVPVGWYPMPLAASPTPRESA